MKTAPSRQRGMSMLAFIMVTIVVVGFGTFAIKTVPAYLDYNTINAAIENTLNDSKVGLMSVSEVRTGIEKRFSVNNVDVISSKDLGIHKEGGYVIVNLDYQVKKELFANIELVMTFKKNYRKSIR